MLGAIILGGGLSQRMGEEKLLLPLGSKTVIERTLSNINHPLIKDKILVLKESLIKSTKVDDGVIVIANKNPEQGQSVSLRLGITYAMEHFEWEGCIIFMGDQPLLSKKNLDDVIQTWLSNKEKIICIEYQNQKGHPTIFGKKWMPGLKAVQGDFGGRAIIKQSSNEVFWVKGDQTCVMDIDTPEDYEIALRSL
ncbi:MAG: nucleotidyltransferase family protein [Eubacteriaceae bacterium]